MENENNYQGWKNYETWNCKLWLDNDAGLQDLQREWLETAKNTPINPIWNREQTTRFTLADIIKEFVSDNNPLSDKATMYTNLLQSAIDNIDFNEIAQNIMSDC